ncbi:MAG: hypothetical protein IJY62_04400 [Clostridia bacterium]|nr:hypothetical protein [Clostridia bacterium]
MKTLRIICTLISAVFIAAVIPVGALVNWGWAGVSAVLAFLFYGLMMLAKMKQEENEQKNATSASTEQTSESSPTNKTE